jgi:hypothetical protein
MTARATRALDAGVPKNVHDAKVPPSTAGNADIPWRRVASALAQESALLLTTSVRNYAKHSRAHGDTVQEVVKVLEGLVRDAAPQSATLAKRSCEVAEWAIEAYFEEPSIRVATWRTESIPSGIRSPSSKSRRA